MPRLAHYFVWISVAAWLTGCASYSNRIREARTAYEAGNYDVAIEQLKPLADKKDNDELLYLMDLGLVYHAAGRYAEAIPVFLRAADLSEIRDYTSIASEAGAVLLSDEIIAYKGEDFEKVLIHIYLAIDYTLLGKSEDALVECRKVNHILDQMITKGNLPYDHNAFAKYLAAALFESQNDLNAAFVDYRQTNKWSPGFPYLGDPLKRVADKLQATQELEQYKKEYPGKDYKLPKGFGEVVVIVEQGKIPIKVPHPNMNLLPTFQKRGFFSDHFVLRDAGQKGKARTYTLYDIESNAIKELDRRIGGIMAKKIAGVVAKQLVASQVAKSSKSEGLGLATALLLHATDSADLRSWTTLPARLQLVRLALPAGRRDLILDMVTAQGSNVAGVKRWDNIEIKAGKTLFLNYRSLE